VKRLLIASLGLLLLAATPAEVAPVLATEGYYIEEGSDADPAVVSDAVAEARFAGGQLSIVVLADEPPGGATTFSDAVSDLLGTGTVLTVAPETVGFASQGDIWTLDQLNAATDASLDGGSDTEVVARFVATLTGEAVGGENPAGSGGSMWPLLVLLLLGAAVVGFFVWRSSAKRKTAVAERLAGVRATAQAKLDDIANDIIAMEEEVELSENEEAKAYYEQASATYGDALGRAERAQTPDELLALSTQLDEAIWQLDCAEALLDGVPLPAKPKPPAPAPAPPAAERASPAEPIPGTEYVRRTTRRSNPMGSDLTDTLLSMMAMGAMSGRGSPFSWGRASGSSSGRSPVPTRIRGGGRRRRG